MQLDANAIRRSAIEFIELALNQRRPREAADRFLGATYTQHEAGVADGAEAFVATAIKLFEQHPEMAVEVRRAAAQDDLVFLHIHFRPRPGDDGLAVVDIFRFDADGRIVEHWEVLQELPEPVPGEHSVI